MKQLIAILFCAVSSLSAQCVATFEYNSSVIKTVTGLDAFNADDSLEVYATACGAGTLEYNMGLARKRAKALEYALRDMGYERIKLSYGWSSSFPKRDPEYWIAEARVAIELDWLWNDVENTTIQQTPVFNTITNPHPVTLVGEYSVWNDRIVLTGYEPF